MENFSNANAHKILRTTICRYCAKRFFCVLKSCVHSNKFKKNN